MTLFVVIVVMSLALLLEGFFSGSELALVSVDKVRLKNRVEQGSKRAKLAQWLINRPAHLFGTTLFGTNLFGITGATVLTFYIIKTFGEEYSSFAMLYSIVILIFGEIVPKSIYQYHANELAPRVSPFLLAFSYICYPFVLFFGELAKLMVKGLKKHVGDEPVVSREELELLITGGELAGGDVMPSERAKIKRILELARQRVKNIMVPLVDVVAVPVTAERDSVEQIFTLKGFSTIPVFEHRMHNIVGVVEDFEVMFAPKERGIRDLMREPIFVPEEMPLSQLYPLLKKKGKKLAIVVDEYGGATGLVTLEDVIEEVVGEIHDEFELGRQYYKELSPGRFIVSGRMEIEAANEKLGLNIPAGNYETIAGYIIHNLHYIPQAGAFFNLGGLNYKIRRATPRAIVEVEVFK